MVDSSPGTAADRDVARGLGLLGRLEQRGVDHPAEGPVGGIEEFTTTTDLQTGRTEQLLGGGLRSSGEEDGVTGPGTDLLGDTSLLLLRDVLGDRTARHTLVGDGDVGQALGASGTSPLLPSVELATR